MTSLFRRACAIASALVAVSALAFAQESTQNTWSHGTTLNLFAGASSEPMKGAFTAGGAIGWQLTPTIAIEGTGGWIDSQSSSPWFTAALKAQARLAYAAGTNPYVEGGIGLCRATFDAGQANVPTFYHQRMMETPGASLMNHTFTDPTFAFGAGLNILVTRHVAIRPAVELTTVFRDRNTLTMTAGVVRLAYHFENHPVTPASNPR
jgi:outer membrane protein with beta-barrel domain